MLRVHLAEKPTSQKLIQISYGTTVVLFSKDTISQGYEAEMMIKVFNLLTLFEGKYRDIHDNSPDEVVLKIQGQYHGVGIRMLKGHPQSQGLTLQRERMRQSLLRVDLTGVLQRWLNSICRRIYSVPCPQAHWHIDEKKF